MNYLFHILIMISIYAILTLSLNLPVGYSGLLSLAQAAFYGIGAYVMTLLMMNCGLSFMGATAVAIIFSSILSLLVSYPSIRLKGDYFILASLAFQIIIFTVLYNWIDLTRGPYGIPGIPKPEILGIRFDNLYEFFALSGGIALIVFFNCKKTIFFFFWSCAQGNKRR